MMIRYLTLRVLDCVQKGSPQGAKRNPDSSLFIDPFKEGPLKD